MMNDQRLITSTSHEDQDSQDQEEQIRDIHALTPPHPPPPPENRGRRREVWETSRSSSVSMASEGASSENFTSMSREFSALVLAGSGIGNNSNSIGNEGTSNGNNLGRIGEGHEMPEEELNPLAIVPDNNYPFDPVPSPQPGAPAAATSGGSEISVQTVKKEEVESKISAWQNAKISKINNRFKREDAIINGWESEQVQKATSWMKKVEVRKLINFHSCLCMFFCQ